ncbi:hypothetical protein [Nannocystis radixulma]|uniref:GyrI-like small molecule binding domain-containing protein n=1 Tax=Nannocystis radixulma TaxID=2995305 RepID=A0ABT5BGK3_9BACT|nr:hypothetical protein [Nannocystis radixulma]MDC0673275.1 hypothetical protein [Nannocystis radixulma]
MTDATILHRVDQTSYEAGLDPAQTSHTVRVWQLMPFRTEWTAVLPVRPGHEVKLRDLVRGMLARCPGIDGGPPRNAVGLLEHTGGRRGMRYDPAERRTWPEAPLYLEFMPAGSDMVYAHYDLAYQILASAAPGLVDAHWYAILSQCEDVLDRWEIAGGRLYFERLQTDEDHAREVLAAIEPSLAGAVR